MVELQKLDQSVDQHNQLFWNELCGTQLAKSLGVTDSSPASLKRFDDWYMGFYPYLFRHVRFEQLRGKDVLEVGLGYGTISQKIAEAGARYHGLDIAEGPVRMVEHRLRQNNLKGEAQRGSILEGPYPDESFDHVIAIGCYHHTGNLQRALDETRHILRPGGRAMVMVYNAYSYRRWLLWPRSTLCYFCWDKFGAGTPATASADERAGYDTDSSGNAAPETVFVSAGRIRKMTSQWNKCQVYRENIGAESLLARFDRGFLLTTFGPIMGLDLYCHLQK